MRRSLLISLSLVLALIAGSTVCAHDKVAVIPLLEWKNTVLKTGQTRSYGPRDDGALQKGGAWPTPRFTDNNNGTVTDNLTGLIWTKNSVMAIENWDDALSFANSLASGTAGLTDGSQAGDWRLPNVRELLSLLDYGRESPALPADNPFENLTGMWYWSSTTYNFRDEVIQPYGVRPGSDGTVAYLDKTVSRYVWCVRGGP